MNPELEIQNTLEQNNPPKGRIHPMIFIGTIVVIAFVISRLLSSVGISKPPDLSAIANLSENDLIYMRCEKFETLNRESQEEIVRKMFVYYKLPIKDDEVQKRREDVNYECSKKPLNKALPQYVRVYLGIMSINLE